jgi:transcriptional regulator with AAA-type ATPase domain
VLFIDEIGDLPLDIQIKLLRILDQKRIMSEHPELVERFPELKKSYS